MEESQIRNFLMICRCSSITAASARLGIAQPSLSQQLLRLEDELGTLLFERTTKGVSITEAGRVFQEHAHTLLNAMGRAREEVVYTEKVPVGEVSFGMPSSTSQLLGVPLLIRAREAFPNISLKIREALSGNIRHWLNEGRCDLAILYDAEGSRHLSIKHVANETLYLVGPKGEFGETDEFGIALHDVDAELVTTSDLILPSLGHGLRRLIDHKLTDRSISITATIEIDSLAHIKTLVSSGLGYSLLSHAGISDELKRGILSAARVNGLDLSRSVSMVRNPSHLITRASLEIEDLATKILREMIAQKAWLVEDEAI